MRIIDNKKDYYDYLAGVLGVDGHITYDRRGSTRLVNKTTDIIFERYPIGYAHIFCSWKNGINPNHPVSTSIYNWDNGTENRGFAFRKYGAGYTPTKSKNYPDAYNVSSNWFCLVIGSVAYMYRVYRILQNETDKEVKIEPVLYRKFSFDRSRTASTAPILIGDFAYDHRSIPWRIAFQRGDEYYEMISKIGYIAPNKDGEYNENPIMEGTWIPSMIPAEEVWNNISDYLLSIREPVIIDNRTDIEHLESAGFDKKTSFRNV